MIEQLVYIEMSIARIQLNNSEIHHLLIINPPGHERFKAKPCYYRPHV